MVAQFRPSDADAIAVAKATGLVDFDAVHERPVSAVKVADRVDVRRVYQDGVDGGDGGVGKA